MWLGEIICHGWLPRVVVGAIGSSSCMGQVIPLGPMMKISEKPPASQCYALESFGAFITSTFVVLNLSGVNLWCHQRFLVHNQPQLSHTWSACSLSVLLSWSHRRVPVRAISLHWAPFFTSWTSCRSSKIFNSVHWSSLRCWSHDPHDAFKYCSRALEYCRGGWWASV